MAVIQPDRLTTCQSERKSVVSRRLSVYYYVVGDCVPRLPLWSSSQSFCLQIQRSRVRFPALPDFLRSPLSLRRQVRSYLNEKVAAAFRKPSLTAVGTHCADHALTSPANVDPSVGVVRFRTTATELISFSFCSRNIWFVIM
jgi:hypothetical protein